jgi:hypothetical protein
LVYNVIHANIHAKLVIVLHLMDAYLVKLILVFTMDNAFLFVHLDTILIIKFVYNAKLDANSVQQQDASNAMMDFI